jgi:hypothetical protein
MPVIPERVTLASRNETVTAYHEDSRPGQPQGDGRTKGGGRMKINISIEKLSLVIERDEPATPAPLVAAATQSIDEYIAQIAPIADETPIEPPTVADQAPTNSAHSYTEGADYVAPSALAAAEEKLEAQYQRIKSLRETIKAQDECIADLKQKLANTAVFIAEPPAPAAELPPLHRNDKRKVRETPTTNTLSKPSLPRLGHDEFDQLVRSEMKRLAPTPGTMVGYKLWDEMRNPRLPTMQAVIRRYGCETALQLATKLGMEPPLGKGQARTEEASEDGAE